MYRLMLPALLAFLSCAPSAAMAGASDGVLSPEKGLDLSRSFEAQRAAIIRALGDGETYVEIADRDRQVVEESLDRMSSLLDGTSDVDQLPEATKVRVFNEQERINSLLSQAHADSRLICRREKPTGSNRSTNTCFTVAERRRAHEAADDFMRYNPRAQASPVN